MRTVRTARLALHPLSSDLASDVLAGRSGFTADPEFPRTDDRSLLDMVADSPYAGGHRYLVVLPAQQQRLVGTLGVAGSCGPDGEQEIGYGLVPSARGRGLGLEAVAALCAVLEREPGVRRLTAQVQHGNTASARLLTRLGFREVAGAVDGHHKLARAAPGQEPPAPLPPARIAGRHVC